MKENITITTAKARLSELVNRLIHRSDTIFITKKGKPAAVLLSLAAYRRTAKDERPPLLSARRALADLDSEIEALCRDAYEGRDRDADREVEL